MRQFFLKPEAIKDGWAVLDGEAFHHLKVLRAKPGEELLLCAGPGKRHRAVLEAFEQGKALARVLESWPLGPVGPRIRLAACLSKGAAFEETLDACTQLGVAEFLPLVSERTVVRLEPKDHPGKLKRWRKLVEAAAEQSNGDEVPTVFEPDRKSVV